MQTRDFGDTETTRKLIYQAIKDGFAKRFPLNGKFVTLDVKNVTIPEDRHFTKEDQKRAILEDRDLTVPVKGDVMLYDKGSGKLLDKKSTILGHLPYYTPQRGTFIGQGTEFSVGNQMRLLPGAYTRMKTNGEIETQFNVQGDVGFRIGMEPKTGKFNMQVGTHKLPLYPILKKLNVSDEELKEKWGADTLAQNQKTKIESIDRLYQELYKSKALPNLTPQEKSVEVQKKFTNLKMNPEVNQLTMGEPIDHVSPKVLVRATDRILNVFRGKESPDDRDALLFKSFHGVEDFLKEKIEKDSGGLAHRLVTKLDKTKSVKPIPAGYFSRYFNSIVKGDSRAFPLEEINPIQLKDNMYRSMVLGEGGVGNIQMINKEARNVNPTQFSFVDPVRGPESEKIGIDLRFAHGTKKGDDKRLYQEFYDAKTNSKVMLNPVQVYNSVIAFPNEIDKSGQIRAMEKGEIKYVPKESAQYYLKSADQMFSIYSNLVPMLSSVQGNRLLMAGKALSDTLPLAQPEAPIVRSLYNPEKDLDFETLYGRQVLAETSPVAGEVTNITPTDVTIKGNDGSEHKVELYNNFPLARKTFISNIPIVKVGDKVKPNQLVAKSNYTDAHGTLSSGKHLLAGYTPFKGMTYEDGVVISESAAKKLTTEEMYKFELPLDEETQLSKQKFTNFYPTIYSKDRVKNIEERGIPTEGATVNKGDPLVLAIKKKALSSTDMALGKLHKLLRNRHDDVSISWEHDTPGEIVHSVITGNTAKIYVKTKTPAQIGDKLTGRYGNKGVISAIVPDNEMPTLKRTGEKLDIALNPMGVISRINPAQIWEGMLQKIGKDTGKIYRMPSFNKDQNYIQFVEKEMKKYGIPDKETVIDPREGPIDIMVTYPYMYRLSKLAESQYSAREMSSYTSNLQPAKGRVREEESKGMTMSGGLQPMKAKKSEGEAKAIGTMEVAALLGHGAKANLRDITTIKGQKNDEYWKALKLGYPLPSPDVPFVYKKFMAMLKASGANTEKIGDVINIMPATDKDIKSASTGAIKHGTFLSARTLEPEVGGFFDLALTGGPSGDKWSHIDLNEPMPSPIMEDSIVAMLDMKRKDFDEVLSGNIQIGGSTGPDAIRKALGKIDVNSEIIRLKKEIPDMAATERDKQVKKLKFLMGLQKTGKKPSDLMLTKFPVIPPVFRPIAMLEDKGTVMTSDANKLYKDMFYANKVLGELKDLPPEELGPEKLNLYNSMKAVAGLGDPITTKHIKEGAKGFIQKIVGEQPKSGFLFDKVISKTQDLVGRGVAVPDPSLTIDEISIPEEMAWKIYRPFLMRELVRRGYGAVKADEMIETKNNVAKDILENIVIKNRPVLMNRAPSLWKNSIMSFFPKLRKDKAIGTAPPIEPPFGLDHDGDTIQIHVPVSEEARKEAVQKMMPSQNLFSLKDFSVHYLPQQEDIFGLYTATKTSAGNTPIKFKSIEEVKQALNTGKIKFDTVVEIDV